MKAKVAALVVTDGIQRAEEQGEDGLAEAYQKPRLARLLIEQDFCQMTDESAG